MNKTSCFLTLIFLSSSFACLRPVTKDFQQAESVINEANMAEYVKALASPEFMGRKPFTQGEQLSINYLEEQFRQLGLQTAFNGSYFQEVPLMEVINKPLTNMCVTGKDGTIELKYVDDFVMFSRRVQPKTILDDVPLVFAGYGIVAPEYGWNDYSGIDVRDKVVIVLVNDPGLDSGNDSLFTGNAMTYYGRWTYKFEEAARQGAIGALIVHNTRGAGYPWSVVVSGALVPDLYLQDPGGYADRCELEGWITGEAAAALFHKLGFNFEQLTKDARIRNFSHQPLKAHLKFTMENTFRYDVSRNVGGLLKGTDLADEVIIYSAHWDHLGIGRVIDGDSIHYGAVDNGTSMAWMLEIARAFSALNNKPRRSILFLAPTAEEEGLLGAHWYVNHPVLPLAKTVANLNNDLMLPIGRMRDVMITGFGQSTLDDLVREAAARQDRYVIPDPTPETGMYYRADHFAFAKVGVPALFARGNCDHRTKGKGWTAAYERQWLANNYHKPADKYDAASWDLSGTAEDAKLAFYIGWKLSNSIHFPQWNKGSEFKATRESYMTK